jgi:hypothetical protein
MVQTCYCSHVENRKLRGLANEVTYIGGDTTNDDLVFAGGHHGSTEVGVIPGVDLTTPADDGDVGVHLGNLREEGAVGASAAHENEWLGGLFPREVRRKKSP